MKKNLQNRLISMKGAVLAGAVLVVTASSAHAAIDTASITAAISDGATAAGVIGAAWLVFVIGIRVFKAVRGAA